MKQLMLLRHADATFTSPTGRDEDRPLSRKGQKQCQQLAAWLIENQIIPQRIRCSPAIRTRETLSFLPPGFHTQEPCSFPRNLYNGGTTEAWLEICALPNSVERVLLIGHNPTLSFLASELLKQPLTLSTCHFVVIELDTDNWGTAETCPARLIQNRRP